MKFPNISSESLTVNIQYYIWSLCRGSRSTKVKVTQFTDFAFFLSKSTDLYKNPYLFNNRIFLFDFSPTKHGKESMLTAAERSLNQTCQNSGRINLYSGT